MLDVYACIPEGQESTGNCDTTSFSSKQALDGGGQHESMVATVLVQFPLEDEPSGSSNVWVYRESVGWDLADPDTPNPVLFASDIAQEFGLSYSQMCELVESIQNQLECFVHENFAYRAPTLCTLNKQQPNLMNVPTVPHLYGEMTGLLQREGSSYPFSHKPKPLVLAAAGQPPIDVTAAMVPNRRRGSADDKNMTAAYHSRIRTLLLEASQKESRARESKGSIQFQVNHHCHICGENQPQSSVFCCGISKHAYCEYHLSERLDFVDSSKPWELDHCPICTLACSCSDCDAKLGKCAVELKRRCADLDEIPQNNAFDEILDFRRALDDRKDRKRDNVVKPKKNLGATGALAIRVPKIPVSDFPRELVDGVDLGFPFEGYYHTKYPNAGVEKVINVDHTIDNATEVTGAVSTPRLQEASPFEDGSVDFCMICKKVGDLLCCDFCPRAFHSGCIQKDDFGDESSWECPSCRHEKGGLLPEDKIDGIASLPKIIDVYGGAKLEGNDLQVLSVLSLLDEMLQILISYDFGYMFRCPVDCTQIALYKTIVKNPMDLGTISKHLRKGPNPKGMYEKVSLADMPLAVLRDIELIWHNCFIFNVEGSVVYRMAEVQQRRAACIRQQSFGHLLSDHVKQELELYIASLVKQRVDYRRHLPLMLNKTQRSSTLPQSRQKISGVTKNRGRPVAVLDPDSGMLVKIYSTLQSACNAVSSISKMKKHRCEPKSVGIDTHGKLRRFILQSQENPNVLMYGFRWFFLDELQSGNVQFSDECLSRDISIVSTDENQLIGFIEMVDDGMFYSFCSIEEALSFPGLSNDLAVLGQKLNALLPGECFVEIDSRVWRRRPLDANSKVAECPANSGDIDGLTTGKSPVAKFEKLDLANGSAFLVGFANVKAAYRDWCYSVDASVGPFFGIKSLETFLQSYLDSDKNVDGMIWRRMSNRTHLDRSDGNKVHTSCDTIPCTNIPHAAPKDVVCAGEHDAVAVNDIALKPDAIPFTFVPSVDSTFAERSELFRSNENNLNNAHASSTFSVYESIGATSQLEATSTTSQSTENSRSSKVFDIETMSSPVCNPCQQSMVSNVVVRNGFCENGNLSLALHVPATADK